MKKRLSTLALLVALLVPSAFAQTEVALFLDPREPIELFEEFAERYEAENPDVSIRFEIGGATSDQQQQYLNTVLSSQSSELDIFQIDVVRPATFAAAGWAEPLNGYFESEEALQDYLGDFLNGPVEADTVDGTLYAIPAYADAQFLYYRSDLLEEYGFEPPTTWGELQEQALAIMEGEGDPNLQGFNYQGAAIEGTVCTFLEALWTAGGNWRNDEGEITVDTPAGEQALEWYQSTLESGITIPNIAEVATDDSRRMFQAGDVVFMLNWGYAWARFQNDEDSAVAGNVGIAPLPAFEGEESATCTGGWQWAINPYSENKDVAFDVIRYYSSPEFQEQWAIQASRIPVRLALYEDPEVLEANPHFEQFFNVIVNARPRPVTPLYSDVSELIRTTMNAFLARSLSVDEALSQMQVGLEDILD
ncbi:MAG: ABC transporter substrate-binding protein [Trueperaceae bacterium]|nr:ABC transporter substrate-binding protein [Trueperaceae bacterium]